MQINKISGNWLKTFEITKKKRSFNGKNGKSNFYYCFFTYTSAWPCRFAAGKKGKNTYLKMTVQQCSADLQCNEILIFELIENNFFSSECCLSDLHEFKVLKFKLKWLVDLKTEVCLRPPTMRLTCGVLAGCG